MVKMDNYYSGDQLEQLWHQIDTLHLSYLDLEESPEKLDTRTKLENCIRDFLCVAMPNQKFYNPETMEILYRSASNKPDFSGYKAATGFNTIQLYAGNLLSQPWRREYYQIKIYSGFYKHHIEANLMAAELLFKAMGYKYVSNGILLLDDPICPDKVTAVSRDCLVAYVECQMLKTIWEELSPIFDITWLHVLEFRKKHMCSPEETIKILKYQYNQRKYQELIKNSYIENEKDYGCLQPETPPQPFYPSAYNRQPYKSHSSSLPVGHKYSYGVNDCCPNMINSSIPVGNCTYSGPTPAPQIIADPYNRYCGSEPHITSKQCLVHNLPVYTVPVAELIKFNSPNTSYDCVDSHSHTKTMKENLLPSSCAINDVYGEKPTEEIYIDKKTNEKRSQFEDWDYVYRDLASQGYSKDLGERGNILNVNMNGKHVQNILTSGDQFLNHKDTQNHIITNNINASAILKSSEDEDILKNTKLKVSDKEHDELQNKNKKTLNKTLSGTRNKSSLAKRIPTEDAIVVSKPIQNKIPPFETSKRNGVDTATELPKEQSTTQENKWECKFCTYLNEGSKDVCEMCSKSKSAVIQPIQIGGTQCSKCTLVNPKDRKTCKACNSSLKDSPTYI